MDALDQTKVAIRQQVCGECDGRSSGGDRLPEPRECEPGCDLFTYLPRLVSVVRRFGAEPPCGYPLAVLNLPCRSCTPQPRSCDDACSGERPLRRFAAEAMAIVESLAREGRV
jgi:hypothetical protein